MWFIVFFVPSSWVQFHSDEWKRDKLADAWNRCKCWSERELESNVLPRIVVAEITAIPIGVSLSLLSHHLVAIAVIAVSVLAVLSFVAVAIRQRQGRRLVGIGTCNSDNCHNLKNMKLVYLLSVHSTYVFVKREACAERSTVYSPRILKNGEILFLIIRDTVINYFDNYRLDKNWKG